MLKREAIRGKMMTGFALPTVIITSVVMMIVLLAGLTATTSTTSNINEQHVDSAAQDTARAGVAMAQECIKANLYTWTTLRTGDTCTGSTSHCTNASCYVLNDTANNQRTWFEVSAPVLDGGYFKVKVTGHYEKLRASDSSSVAQTVNAEYQAKIPTPYGGEIRELSLGHRNMCVATVAGGGYCLGGNLDYTLGTGQTNTSYNALTFEQITSGFGSRLFTDISVNSNHACGVASGKVYCWGRNDDGGLGNGVTNGSSGGASCGYPTPQEVVSTGVLSGKTIRKVVTMGTQNSGCLVSVYEHTCALDTDGYAYCWGADGNDGTGGGQLGNGLPSGNSGDSNVPVAVSGGHRFIDIDGGSWSTCAIKDDGKLWCWGADNNGQIGNGGSGGGTVTHTPVPTRVQGVATLFLGTDTNTDFTQETFTQISTGQAHNCAVSASGELWCWGQNGTGQLGGGDDNNSIHYARKVALPSGQVRWTQVAAGNYWTCAIAQNVSNIGKVYCWGTGAGACGYTGWVGDGNSNTCRGNVRTPTAVDVSGVMAGKDIKKIWAGSYDAIAKDSNGQFYGWGWGGNALLGDGVNWPNWTPYRWSPIDSTHLTAFNAGGGAATGSTLIY